VPLTLNDLLALVGRLDDAPGFDTPRERFRRFLFERVIDARLARTLVEQGQRAPGEQHRRALQDAVVLLGRFLGFETAFGTYQRMAGAPKYDGLWRSRHRLEIVLELRPDHGPRADVEELLRTLSSLVAPSHVEPNVRRLGLCVVTPLHAGRARLEDALAGDTPHSDIRIISTRSLLWLAEAVSVGELKHDEVLRLLTSGGNLDLVVDLMERLASGPQRDEPHAAPEPAPDLPGQAEPGYWVATIERADGTTPEQFVDGVVRKRQLLGISSLGPSHTGPRTGDWVCFSVRGKGIVGHGRVESIPDGPKLLRGADRFSLVCALRNVEIYDAPIAFPSDGPSLAALSPTEFAELTAHAASLEDLRSTA
jgi:hypothetical protein